MGDAGLISPHHGKRAFKSLGDVGISHQVLKAKRLLPGDMACLTSFLEKLKAALGDIALISPADGGCWTYPPILKTGMQEGATLHYARPCILKCNVL